MKPAVTYFNANTSLVSWDPFHDSFLLPWCPFYQISKIILCSVGKGLHLLLALIKMMMK